jgi:hypothetical protein
MQDICIVLANLRNSINSVYDESTVLTYPASSVIRVVKALGDVTSLEYVRKMLKKIIGPC